MELTSSSSFTAIFDGLLIDFRMFLLKEYESAKDKRKVVNPAGMTDLEILIAINVRASTTRGMRGIPPLLQTFPVKLIIV